MFINWSVDFEITSRLKSAGNKKAKFKSGFTCSSQPFKAASGTGVNISAWFPLTTARAGNWTWASEMVRQRLNRSAMEKLQIIGLLQY